MVGKATAWIQSDDASVAILRIDGRAPSLWKGYSTSIELQPGLHELFVAYRTEAAMSSSYVIRLVAQAGHLYKLQRNEVRDERNNIANVWIVDTVDGKVVGDILSAQDEPVSRFTPVFNQSPFFSWTPPQDEGWLVLGRNNSVMSLRRRGAKESESYVIGISVFTLPLLNGEDDFIDLIKKGRARPDPEAGRFDNLEDSVAPIKGAGDFCIQFHHVAIDKRPQGELKWGILPTMERTLKNALPKQPMTMESYGYTCRTPKNPKLGIHFEYSHRAFGPERDAQMRSVMEQYFSALKF